MHPAIPVIDAVSEHVEGQFQTITRGKKHTTPQDKKGINLLKNAYISAKIHDYCRKRTMSKQDHAPDLVDRGVQRLQGVMKRWKDGRTYPRATSQDYPSSTDEETDIAEH